MRALIFGCRIGGIGARTGEFGPILVELQSKNKKQETKIRREPQGCGHRVVGMTPRPVAERFYTPKQDTSQDGITVDYLEQQVRIRGINVHIYQWSANRRRPHAIVHISHGAGEHARRYQRLANILAAAGYTVIADDHYGHGRTGVGAYGLGQLGPEGVHGARRAVREVLHRIRAEHSGLPIIELGHSWGSLMAQQLFRNNTDLFDALVLSGTTLAQPGLINVGNYNAAWDHLQKPHGLSWLSRDETEVHRMLDDPYGFDIAHSSVWSPLGALGLLTLPPLPRRGRDARLPVLILGGDHDPLSYGGRGARALAWAYRHVTRLQDVELRIYPGARHEVFNELDRDTTTNDLLRWLAFRFEPPASAAEDQLG